MIHVLVGTQWGDEGKGKYVDWLASRFYDIVARYQGGPNAGHTIIHQGEKLVLHMIPSGITQEGKLNVMGNGMVVDIEDLDAEIRRLRDAGIGVVGKLFISPLIHLILPFHKEIDRAKNGSSGIGSTGRGIGPAYADKYARKGVRIADLANPELFEEKAIRLFEEKKQEFPDVDFSSLRIEETCARYCEIYKRIAPLVVDIPAWLKKQAEQGRAVLCEGAQATFLDIDFGTYPYVTSSHPVSGGVSIGLGIPPNAVRGVWGVAKAYTTRVGGGPFPTELAGEQGDRLREWGAEYGSTTDRPRRCGWFDAVLVKRACLINGIEGMYLTKLDVLSRFSEIKVCYGYEGSMKWGEFPATAEEMAGVRPRYTTLPGWQEDISQCRKREDLPLAAHRYIEKLEELVGVRIGAVSVGPERDATIEL